MGDLDKKQDGAGFGVQSAFGKVGVRERKIPTATGEQAMLIGERLRQLRQERGMTRADIEQASGLMRSYISRVELGQSIPSLEALERFAAALEVPLYWLFYVEESEVNLAASCPQSAERVPQERRSNDETRFLMRLAQLTGRRVEADPAFLLDYARQFALGKPEN
jgi:transcriptional regulator with XRE-family HTH domain